MYFSPMSVNVVIIYAIVLDISGGFLRLYAFLLFTVEVCGLHFH